MAFMKKILFATLIVSTVAVHAAGLESLENFVKSAKSGKADFTQVVTAPSRDGQPPRVKTSTGTFEFSRPNRFRFNYKKPFEQAIVADGQTLWLHDVDLNQVTARKQQQVLGSTPAALIAAWSRAKSSVLRNSQTRPPPCLPICATCSGVEALARTIAVWPPGGVTFTQRLPPPMSVSSTSENPSASVNQAMAAP